MCDRVYRQVATLQILRQGDRGAGIHAETTVAGTGFAFLARERVFFARLRVQEHGEVAADLAKPQVEQVLCRRADDYPVALVHREPQELVAYGAAHQVHVSRDALDQR